MCVEPIFIDFCELKFIKSLHLCSFLIVICNKLQNCNRQVCLALSSGCIYLVVYSKFDLMVAYFDSIINIKNAQNLSLAQTLFKIYTFKLTRNNQHIVPLPSSMFSYLAPLYSLNLPIQFFYLFLLYNCHPEKT